MRCWIVLALGVWALDGCFDGLCGTLVLGVFLHAAVQLDFSSYTYKIYPFNDSQTRSGPFASSATVILRTPNLALPISTLHLLRLQQSYRTKFGNGKLLDPLCTLLHPIPRPSFLIESTITLDLFNFHCFHPKLPLHRRRGHFPKCVFKFLWIIIHRHES